MAPLFVATPWRDADELLSLRCQLFAADADDRERGVAKLLAWRARKLDLPLLLESTGDLVAAQVRDSHGASCPHAVRLLYAAAIARFVTGVLDSLPPSLPVALRETRHRIVHRHLPALAELKRAAADSLAWLWENYWSHLDALLRPAPPSTQLAGGEVRERVQGVLRTYVKERKAEIKRRATQHAAADGALGKWLALGAPRDAKARVLLDLLVDERDMLPAGRKLGASMEGAYLIWTPFLAALCTAEPAFVLRLTERLVGELAATGGREDDAVRDGWWAWCLHVLTSEAWGAARRRGIIDDVLSQCFTAPTCWTLKLAESLLKDEHLPGRKSWLAVLEAARSADGEEQAAAADAMDVDTVNRGMPVAEPGGAVKKICGPQRKPGLWRPQPIGWTPPGWEA